MKSLVSLCGCAGRFESYVVGNPEERFSRDEAQSIRVLLWVRIDGNSKMWNVLTIHLQKGIKAI